ncbi:MAG TPA: hypothetical protein VK968_14965 [Roseimicrobium sp.]|nr:hypothetical protein [Roseimicrobium sp.]
MKRLFWLLTVAMLSTALLAAPSASTSSPDTKTATAKPASGNKSPGLELAQNLSMVTGVAISPLLGVSAVGAWKYMSAESGTRKDLPWYAQVWFWLPALGLVGLVAAKDLFGTMVPTALKKPIDVAEALENKVSGLVAAGAFLPLAVSFSSSFTEASLFHGTMMGAIDLAPLYKIISVPVSIIIFAIVWLVSHAINMLILISPFATVDAALKSFRTFILGSVVASSWFNAYMGAAWCVVLIIICYFLAGWAFRLTTSGSIFIFDYLTFHRARFRPDPKSNRMFLARETSGVPIRTYGRLHRNEAGKLVFDYRPWLFLKQRTLELPEEKFVIGKGLVYPEVLQKFGDDRVAVFTLPPRYLTHEQELSDVYGLGQAEDTGIVKGLKSVGNAIRELFGGRAAATA